MLEATCSIDIVYFPFDTQTCELKFVAWSYTKADVNLNIGSKGILLNDYLPNSQWDIKSTSASETDTFESSVTFSVTMRRKPLFYVLNVILPVILLTILNCFTFMLPVVSGERASYGITVFLSLAVFLTIVASELPKNSDKTSWLAVYLIAMTTLSTLIVVICLIEIRLSSRTPEEEPLSKPYHFIYKFCQILRCKTCRRQRVNDIGSKALNGGVASTQISVVDQELGSFEQNKMRCKKELRDRKIADEIEITWINVVNAIDFFAFWLSILATVIFTTIFLSVSYTKG